MPPSKFNKLLPQLLRLDVGLGVRTGTAPSSKALRRTSQSLCQICELQIHERLPFGNWQDDFTDRASRCRSTTQNMPHVYTDVAIKERAQLDAKTFVWSALQQAFDMLGKDIAEVEWSGAMATILQPMCKEMRQIVPVPPAPTGTNRCEE